MHETAVGSGHEVCARDARPDRTGGLHGCDVFTICVPSYYNNITSQLRPRERDDRGLAKVYSRQRGSAFSRRWDAARRASRENGEVQDAIGCAASGYMTLVSDLSVWNRRTTPSSIIKDLESAGCHLQLLPNFRIRTHAREVRSGDPKQVERVISTMYAFVL